MIGAELVRWAHPALAVLRAKIGFAEIPPVTLSFGFGVCLPEVDWGGEDGLN